MALPRRSPTFYRLVLALPVLMLGYLLASGRLAAYWHFFSPGSTPPTDSRIVMNGVITVLLWLGAVAPLMYAAWEIGREHTAARRLNYTGVVGLREVVRRALGAERASEGHEREAAFARPPRDDPRVALAWGAIPVVMVPAFFSLAMPDLRTPRALVWLGVAGLLMGGFAYCRRRAVAYLVDEPARLDFFRAWRLLNPARYERHGRVFVRWQIALIALLPIWWVGVGPVILFNR
ncbi:MAG TPA: hypothetical protein VIR34_14175 [Gemmatimonadaceae bacterium]|jgi:hypothetical protein